MFKVNKETYNKNSDFGANQLTELCNLLGMKLKNVPSYGYATGIFKDNEFSLQLDRSKPTIRLYAPCLKNINIKELSDKQIVNLVKKLDEYCQARIDSENRMNVRNELYDKLKDVGIIFTGRTIYVNESEFYIDIINRKLTSYSKFDIKLHYYFDTITANDIRDEIETYIKEFETQLNAHNQARLVIEKHLDLIIEYIKLI